jgi:hypothetical protein
MSTKYTRFRTGEEGYLFFFHIIDSNEEVCLDEALSIELQ